MTEVSTETALKLLKDAVELKGEGYRYPTYTRSELSCHYAYEGQPDCIVGHVLVALGVPVSALDYNDPDSDLGIASGSISGNWHTLEEQYDLAFDDGARVALEAAQSMQDAGWSWGRSYKCALEAVKSLKR